ncbi:MAG TPA: NAD-dependent succinate-semialdehyde dehydrogenase [Nocardioides sp.]
MTASPTITTVDPATGLDLATYDVHDEAAVDAALAAAHAAYVHWSQRPVAERCDLLRAVGKLLVERREDYAALITAEMGKPLAEALAEVDKCAWNCEVVADSAPSWLADQEVASSASRSWVSYEPLGVVLAVMPWNYPFWQVLRFACAALVAGDAGVLKHSPNVTGCALAIEQLLADAGAPAGLFTTLVLADSQLAEMTPRIVGDPRVAAVTLTGSERAGEAIGAAAGRALKKSVLELGGSDPFVVLDDADLVAAAKVAVRSRFGNGGQSCIAAKRFIVAESVADEFVRLFIEEVGALVVGDPTDPLTTVGPMARDDLREALARQVSESVAQGAELVCGGSPIDAPGSFFEPTVLDHVVPGMTAFGEETFGPVAAIVRASDDDHAVDLANDTDYGLGASVWSRSDRGLAVGRRIRSGALFVNAMVASDPRLPFGGTGRSGFGRELSAEGTREFTNVRTMYVNGRSVG